MMRSGSLCTGYGGLDQAVAAVLPVEQAWVSEIDPAPSKILAHRYPTVPNLGDLTAIDWATVPPVDLLTAGFPCQDVSSAGLRAGIRPGNRSGLWFYVATAISVLRPPLVLLENVRGLLSARAHSDVEPCPWCLGNGPDEPVLRALGAVLGDLTDLRYDAIWVTVSAASVGAPHRRERVFILAWPAADTGRSGWRPAVADVRPGQPDPAGCGADADGLTLLPTPAARLGDGRGTPNTDTASRRMGDEGRRNLDDAVALLPTPTAMHSARNATAGRTKPPNEATNHNGWTLADVAYADRWGDYGPAIHRWERVLGRPAPNPTEPNRTGGRRLAPRFVEWMQGLPDGWVTAVPGLTRNDQLKALGNGVVPQQGAAAFAQLLAVHNNLEVAA